MRTRLRVQVRVDGHVVEDRVCSARRGMLGEADGSLVAFPGTSLAVRRIPGGWRVADFDVLPGTDIELDLGNVQLRLEAIEMRRLPRPPIEADVRVLVATLAVMLAGASWQTATSVVRQHPEESQQVIAGVRSWTVGPDASPRLAPQRADSLDPGVDSGPTLRPSESLAPPVVEGLHRPPAVFVPGTPVLED